MNLVAPQIFPFSFGDEPLNAGEAISIQCSIMKGDFPMEIKWSLNGQLLENNYDIAINNISKRLSSLSIEYVQAEHAGNYTCTATNEAGFTSYTANLIINGICHMS